MASFLIDFENVRNIGMIGCEKLDETDSVYLFYSESAKHIQRRWLDIIKASNCKVEFIKLINIGKNALDFYIAAKVGELAKEEAIIIVSRDQGFLSLADYVKNYCFGSLCVSPSIEKGMVDSKIDDLRRAMLKLDMENVDISEYVEDEERKSKIREDVIKLFEKSPFIDKVEDITNIISSRDNWKGVYNEVRHVFGTQNGLEVYHIIRGNLLDYNETAS